MECWCSFLIIFTWLWCLRARKIINNAADSVAYGPSMQAIIRKMKDRKDRAQVRGTGPPGLERYPSEMSERLCKWAAISSRIQAKEKVAKNQRKIG